MNTHNPTGAEVIDFPNEQSIEMQATAWMVKLDDGEPSAELKAAFKAWVNEAPEHRKAFEQAVAFSEDMNRLTQVVLPREKTQARPRNISWPVATACTLLLAFIVLMVVPDQSPERYVTAVGEQKTLKLADNSTVLLNTNSELVVQYSEAKRKLVLIKGEAHFDVAKNPNRPFEVVAGEGLVRAVGTAFTVHLRQADVEVIVTEGIIEIDQSTELSPNTLNSVKTSLPENPHAIVGQGLQIEAGKRLTYDSNLLAQIELDSTQEMAKALSWHQGVLSFDGETLEEVVEEVGRYTELKIVIPERAARELKVGGLFKVGDTAALFEALRDGFGMHVKVVSEDVVYLISEENH